MKPTDPLQDAMRILEGSTLSTTVAQPAKDLADAERVMTQIAELTAQRDKRQAALDLKIAKLKEDEEPSIQKLNDEITAWQTILEVWAVKEKKEERQFIEKKSIDFFCGTIGFRGKSISVQLLKGWTEKTVLETLHKFRVLKTKYIATKESLKKAQILADYRAGAIDLATAKKFGVSIEENEPFFCEVTAAKSATQPV